MKLGFSLPTAGAWATPENQIRIAREAEALGYHSLWVFQRLLYALEPKNEYPPVPGKTWPKPFERVFDPIVTLAYVAAATRRIRLGTSVLIMPFYQPVVLAKQLATLDVLSGGRLDVGLGL
ncbi:MAG TPA: LLM class flavin-dependent oxidoreductase, partial [Methylomirabilota bacterium]